MKSKSTAYILCFFLGVFGVHKFYLNKAGIGILYFFTLGLVGIGWIIDLFTLGNQVDAFNALVKQSRGAKNVVNTPDYRSAATQRSLSEQLHELHMLKEKGILSEEEYARQKSKVLS
ncbi:NINE protein [Mucilaginibacter ginsenosidivorax]|uniref:NINE protein n=1 Tax=Mucilaginibacter ginsenosidivorax TaxID=862126 RepID=A0A5B8VWF2_9SPHI|nr:NINE protein [Mucilaginibacter ginsenosidivorax]QEC74558.1 NINE protein [Mucilaginibacter ginsenosidivorax]